MFSSLQFAIAQWQDLSNAGLGDIIYCKFLSPQNGWIVNLSNPPLQGLLRTTNGGMAWTKILDHQPGTFNWIEGFDFLDDSIGYAFSNRRNKCFRTVNGGQTWDTTGCVIDPFSARPTIRIMSPELAYYGSSVDFNKGADSLRSWQVIYRFPHSPIQPPAFKFVFLSRDTIIACGGRPNLLINEWNGTIECYKSSDGGYTWGVALIDTLAQGLPAFGNESVGYTFSILGETDTHYKTHKTTNGGNSWFQIPATIDAGVVQVTDAYFKNPNEGFITGGAVAHSSDGGLTWHTIPGLSGAYMSWPDSLHGWIVGPNGRIFRTTTGGLVPALFGSFTGEHTGGTRVQLAWRTTAETNTAGFHLQRRSENDTAFADISPLIPGRGTTSEPTDYSVTDTAATINRWYYRVKAVPLSGTVQYSGEILVDVTTGVSSGLTQYEYKLEQNYPNPFNPSTRISFSVATAGFVSLKVFDLLGREVAALVNEERVAGRHEVTFPVPDASNATNLSSGMYILRLSVGNFTASKKLLLLR